jgi:hypothetical protein
MDEKKILIANLSIGLTGKENVDLIGSMLITKIFLAALSRANLKEEQLKKAPKFYFFVDEFQNFVNESFTQILSQARKYNLSLTVAHQYIEQLTDTVRAAVFGNVGSMITFRVGAEDAEKIEKEFAPQFTADDIVNLGFSQIYLRLSINGTGSKPFSAKTLPPIAEPEHNFLPAIIAHSRTAYGKERSLVEEEIKNWYNRDFGPEKPKLTEPRPVSQVPVERPVHAPAPVRIQAPAPKPPVHIQKPIHTPRPVENRSPEYRPERPVQKPIQKLEQKISKPNHNLRDALNKALSVNLSEEKKKSVGEVPREELEKLLEL